MKRLSVFVLLVSATWSVGQTGLGRAEQEVLQVESERVQAVVRADTAALDRILADELTYTHSTGRVDSKPQFIGAIQSGELTYLAMKHDDVRVRVYGDVAVLAGRSAAKVKSPRTQGQTMDLDIRFLNVYARRNARWQQVAWQSTRIAPQ